jgi:Ser/Thr protein kinase RdoA (MazF antagonist)
MIFQPNNHSQWNIKYKPVSSETAENIRRIAGSYYDIKTEEILNIEQVDEAEINSNNFKITIGKGAYLLRRYVGVRDENAIEETLKLTEEFAGEGVKVPRLKLSRDKKLFVTSDNNLYALFMFIKADHYRGTREEIESAGREIGKLDKVLSGLSVTNKRKDKLSFPAKTKELRLYNIDVWKKIFQEARNQQKNSSADQFHAELLAKEDFILKIVGDMVKNKPLSISWSVVHFDLHPHNLLANGKEVVAIIDFDSLRYLEKMRALAFALHRMVRQYIIFNDLTDYPKAVTAAKKIFLDAYQSVCKIDEKELETAAYFIKDEALSRLTYAMKDNYFNNNPSWRQDLDKQTANLAEAIYF